MPKICLNKSIEKRKKVMVLIVNDLNFRQNAWVPRRDTNAPKTIEQIHKDAEDEATQKQITIQRVMQEQQQYGNQRPNRGQQDGRGG